MGRHASNVEDHWGQFHQRSHEQLLGMQIPKAQKNPVKLSIFFCAFDISASIKAACRTLMKLTPGRLKAKR